MSPIKLMIADDHCLFREGLKSLLGDFKNIAVIGEAGNGKMLVEEIKKERPDVILMDLNMPVMDGIETIKHIKIHFPEIKIIALTMHGDEKFVMYVIGLGVNSYLLKSTISSELESTIYKVMELEYFFNEDITRIMHKGILTKKNAPKFDEEPDLSPQELKVLKLICQEYTIHEISEKVFLSPRTVEGYRQKLLKKTKSKNTAGIVKFAMRLGLIE
ncbi:MAG: two component transcriptional regulator, LuxR family [Bacteroidetes bacterium]|nr:two component transcriptional regulator, LuxR family [Bacteroidota bacterium]